MTHTGYVIIQQLVMDDTLKFQKRLELGNRVACY
jgi:hypothetical protein